MAAARNAWPWARPASSSFPTAGTAAGWEKEFDEPPDRSAARVITENGRVEHDWLCERLRHPLLAVERDIEFVVELFTRAGPIERGEPGLRQEFLELPARPSDLLGRLPEGNLPQDILPDRGRELVVISRLRGDIRGHTSAIQKPSRMNVSRH